MRYWRIGLGFATGEEKVDMVGTILSGEMVRPRLAGIRGFSIRMGEDLLRKGIPNSSISFDLLNHDGIYTDRLYGDETIWIELDGRRVYTGNATMTPGNHPNFLTLTADTELLGLDEPINMKISADDYPNVPAVNEGNWGNIIGGRASDEDAGTPAGVIPCYKVDTGKYLLAWHHCYQLLGAYLEDGTDILSAPATLSNQDDDRSYVLYTDTDPDVIYVNVDGLVYNSINLTKESDTDQQIDLTISIPEGHEVIIYWGDGDSDTVTGPQSSTLYSHTYADTAEYDIQITKHIEYLTEFKCSNEPISGDVSTFQYCRNMEVFWIDRCDFSGDVESLEVMENLNSLLLYNNNSLEGNTSSFSSMTLLTVLYIGDTLIEGSLNSLSTLTLMQYLKVNSTSVDGPLSALQTMTDLRRIYANGSSVSGDIQDLSVLEDLGDVYLYGSSVDTYTQGTLPDWDNCSFYIYSLGLSQQEVDDFLVDMDNMSTASTEVISMAGSNAAPSAVGLAAKTSLIAKGWTVTTN